MLSLDAILLQSLVARPYGILKLFPDHVRANERTTHLHTFIDNNSFPKHSHRVRVRDDVYFSANLISIFQWWSSKLCSVSSKLWWVRSPLSALKLYRFFFTFTSHFSPSSNVFSDFFLDLFPVCWYLFRLFSCVLSFFLWKCHWNDAAPYEFTKDNNWKTTFFVIF